jgi:hypothetical protein
MSIDIQGIPTVIQNLQGLMLPKAHILADALSAEGHKIMAQSIPLVPVLSGRLRSSAEVGMAMQEGPVVSVDLGYGRQGPLGPAPYAAKIEFDVTLNHPRGGQAHYLGQPFRAAENRFMQDMAQAIQQGLGFA